MTVVLAICVAVTFAVSIYLMLGRELKGIAMGVFLLGHAANLSIIAMSGSPVREGPDPAAQTTQSQAAVHADHADGAANTSTQLVEASAPGIEGEMKHPPILSSHEADPEPLAQMVDPLPQALILTAIVIGFGVMAFLLTLLVVTNRKTRTLEVDDLAKEGREA